MADDTLVIYTSDHGDLAGDHDTWGKVYLYEPSVHVPFIVRGPGVRRGARSAALVELIDVGATVCDAMRVPTHHWDQGRTLMPLLRGECDQHRTTIYAEMGSDKMLFDGRYKLLYGNLKADRRTHYQQPPYHGPAFGRPVNLPPDRIALYDLVADPAEQFNLAEQPECAQLVNVMQTKLLNRLIENMQAAPEDAGSVL
jgi:arylsulfatase